jgi:hypothetical protein
MARAEDRPGRESPFRHGRAARGLEAMRWGLGPVFFYECLANSRRWQTYAIRSAGVALLLAAIATIAISIPTIDPGYAWREYAALGVSCFYALIGVELSLVMLAAPAATAGATCVDRARGTLAHMLVPTSPTPRSSWASWPRGSCRSWAWWPAPGRSWRSLRSWAESIPWR